MKKEQILNEVKKYFEQELESATNFINYPPTWECMPKGELIKAHLQRCLGVCQFVQHLGVPFAEISVIYDETREKFENLLLTNE